MKLTEKLLNEIYKKITLDKNGPFNTEKLKEILKKEINKNELKENTVENLFNLIMAILKKEIDNIKKEWITDLNLTKENLNILIKKECLKKNIIIDEVFLNKINENF